MTKSIFSTTILWREIRWVNLVLWIDWVFFLFLIFCWTKVHFVGATDCPCFGLCVTLPMGFKARVVLLTYTLTSLHAVNLRVMSGATTVFSTNRGVHCISVYTAGPPSRHPLMQAVESRQWWMLTFGSSEIRSCAARSTSESAIHLATPVWLLNWLLIAVGCIMMLLSVLFLLLKLLTLD